MITVSSFFQRGLLFILATIWGQLLSIGELEMFKICPIFKDTEIATVVMAFWLNIYYIVVLSWNMLSMRITSIGFNCTVAKLCNIPRCRSEYESLTCDSNRTIAKYFNVQIVYLPIISIFNAYLLADTWIIIAGRRLGLEFYLKPNFEKLLECKVWVDAVIQVFFSYGLGLGALVALGSYNSYHNNIYRQTLMICFVNSATSVFVGFDNVSFIGFVAVEQGKPVEEVVQSDPGLLFLAYPSGILQLPYTNVWSILFFTTILFLGIDSQASYYKYLNSV